MTENSHLFVRTDNAPLIYKDALEQEYLKICKQHGIMAIPWIYDGKRGIKMDAIASNIFRGEAID